MPPKVPAAQGGSTATGNQASKESEVPIDIERLIRLPLRSYTARNCYSFLHHRIPWMTNVESSWRLTGFTFLSFPPSAFVDNLRLELSAFPFSVVCEIFDVIKNKIIADAAADPSESNIPQQVLAQWQSAPKASFPVGQLNSSFTSPIGMQVPVWLCHILFDLLSRGWVNLAIWLQQWNK